METVAVHSDADADAPYVAEADYAVRLPGNAPTDTYLRGDLLIDAARRAGADAVHPGYGFLSENAEFAQAVQDAGLLWVGPPPKVIDVMGSKIEAKQLVADAGVPTLPTWHDPLDVESYPVLVKASAGGGGRGMRLVRDASSSAGRRCVGPARGRVGVRRRHGVLRALRGAGPAHRGPDHRRLARQRGLARRAGVLDPAAAPEDHRGDAVAGRRPRCCGRSCAPRPSRPLAPSATSAPERSSSWSSRRRATVLLPRDEHPAAGRAPGHRTGGRHRPGAAAVAGGRGRHAAVRRAAAAARARRRGPPLRRGPDAAPGCPARAPCTGSTFRASSKEFGPMLTPGAAARLRCRRRARWWASTTTRCSRS